MSENRNEQLSRAVQMVAEAAALVELAGQKEENKLTPCPKQPPSGETSEAAPPPVNSLSLAIEKMGAAMESIQNALG